MINGPFDINTAGSAMHETPPTPLESRNPTKYHLLSIAWAGTKYKWKEMSILLNCGHFYPFLNTFHPKS